MVKFVYNLTLFMQCHISHLPMLLAVTKGINKGVHRQHLYGVDKRAEAGACLYPDGVWHMRPLPHLPAYVLIHTQSVNVLLEGLSVV